MSDRIRGFNGDAVMKNRIVGWVRGNSAQGLLWHPTGLSRPGDLIGFGSGSGYRKRLQVEGLKMGIPPILLGLYEEILERLRGEPQTSFPGDFLDAIPVGADLVWVWAEMAIWILVEFCAPPATAGGHPKSVGDVAALWALELLGTRKGGIDWDLAGREAYAAAFPSVTGEALWRAREAALAASRAAASWRQWRAGTAFQGVARHASLATEKQQPFWEALAVKFVRALKYPAEGYQGMMKCG